MTVTLRRSARPARGSLSLGGPSGAARAELAVDGPVIDHCGARRPPRPVRSPSMPLPWVRAGVADLAAVLPASTTRALLAHLAARGPGGRAGPVLRLRVRGAERVRACRCPCSSGSASWRRTSPGSRSPTEPFEAVEPYLLRRARRASSARRRSSRRGWSAARRERSQASPRSIPRRGSSRSSATGAGDVSDACGARSTATRSRPRRSSSSAGAASSDARGRARTAAHARATTRSSELDAWLESSVGGAGAIGASVAFHLASLGAREVVLADRGRVAGGATSKAMGGVRQQFSTAAEVRLAQASIRFFEELGAAVVRPGRLPLPGHDGRGARRSSRPARAAGGARRSGRARRARRSSTACDTTTSLGAVVCCDRRRRGPARRDPRARPAGDSSSASRCARTPTPRTLEADVLVIACGPWSAEVGAARGVELPVRPLCRQLLATTECSELPDDLADGARGRDRLPLPPPRHDRSSWRWSIPSRAGASTSVVDETLFRRPARAAARTATRPRPRATIERRVGRALRHDPRRAPDPRRGRRRRLCGLPASAGHGFMQSPAVGRALAEEISA